MNRRDSLVDQVVGFIDAGRVVIVRSSAGMGKTTVIGKVIERRGVAKLEALPSLSAKGIALGAFAAIVPVSNGDATSRVAGVIAHLRDEHRLLVVDDCHLLDDESATVLHLIARERPLLLTVRSNGPCPDGILRLMADDCAEVVDLPALTLGELTGLAEGYVTDLIDRRTLELLLSASEGNPLWAKEILAANQRAGSLRRAGGVWTIDDFVGALSVGELLRERVASWTPAVRNVASTVAAGGMVPTEILTRICGRPGVHEALLVGAVQKRADGLIELAHAQLSDAVLASAESQSRERNLLALVDAADYVSADWFMIYASWLLELGTFRAANAELLTAAARRSFDGTNQVVAQRLVEAAIRAGGGDPARELLVRVQSARGHATEQPVSQRELHAAAIGATEAFAYGLRPAHGVRALLLEAMAAEEDHDRRVELEAFDLAVGMQLGDPVQPIVDALLAITESSLDVEVVRVAGVSAATAMVTVGQYERVGLLCARLDAEFASDNVFQNLSLAVSGAEAMLWAGRSSEAKLRANERLRDVAGADTAVAAVFLGGFDGQVAMVEGNPRLAARILGSVASGMYGIDASGVLSWTQAYLRWALAWAGQPVEDGAPIVAPPQGQLLARRIEFFQIMATAEMGMVREARRLALDFADRAEADGHFSAALHALHLAGRIQVTRNLVERVDALSGFVDGDLAVVIRDHLAALSSADGADLEKVAERFEASGQLALAHEAFGNGSISHSQHGSPSLARRCRAEAGRLQAGGVTPTFVARKTVVEADTLTPRESEVALLAATGRSNGDIGKALGLSARTIETHLQHAYVKLGVNDRARLAKRLKANQPD